MNQVIHPARSLQGKIQVPADKSITHRAILFSSLAEGTSTVTNPLMAEDCLSTARCIESLGIRIKKKKGQWTIEGHGLWGYKKPHRPLDCGNSGTTMRLLSGILAGQDFDTRLLGDASLSKRPMDRVSKPLSKMGAVFHLSRGKFAPFTIRGEKPLHSIVWKNPISSAQVKSCLLLAGLHAQGKTTFIEPSLSRDHTERMLAAMGASLKRQGLRVSIQGMPHLRAQRWTVPGDFSSAAFFLAAGLLIPGADIEIQAVNLNPTRTGLLRVLQFMGAKISVKKKISGGEPMGSLHANQQASLNACRLDSKIVPHLIDEIPILAVVATQAKGRSVLRGIGDLRVKETDRIKAVAVNLKKMGACVIEQKEALIIDGPTPLHGAIVDSFDDHRIAMSMAIAGLIAKGPTTIRHGECVSISFPGFWKLLQKIQSAR